MLRRIGAALVAVALMVAAAGCGGDEEEAQPAGGQEAQRPQEMTRITVGALPISDLAPLFLGIERGFFRQENLDVETKFAEGGAALIPAVLAEEFQFAFANPISLLLAQERGLPVQIVTEAVQGGTNEENSSNALIVTEESGIRSVEDMAGKTFAVNTLRSMGEVTIKATLEKAGVNPNSARFIEVPFPEMNAALEGGAADVAWEAEPFVTQALNQGFRKITDWAIETHPRLSLSTYFGAKPYLEENPAVRTAFERAMNRSLDYARTHEREVRRIIPTYTQIPPEVVREIRIPHFTSELNVASIRRIAELGQKYGVLKNPDVDAIVPAGT